MRNGMRPVLLGGVWLLLGTSVALAAPSPGTKCQSAKNHAAGKYAACLSKAEAKLLKATGTCTITTATECSADHECPASETCAKRQEDTDKYTTTVDKCLEKFNGKWESLTRRADDAGNPCPDGLASSEIQGAIDEHVANVAAGLAGEGLSVCSGELGACTGDLTTCESDLGATETQLDICESALSSCDTDLTSCESDLVEASNCGNGEIDGNEACDQGNVNGRTCVSEGFLGGLLRCDAGCTYDTSECYALRFVHNANGTITDNGTGLIWEAKVRADTIVDLSNHQDADNAYPWAGTCSVSTSKRCQPDATSQAACLAGVEGDPSGCARCVGGEGTCTVTPNGTIWQELVALNAADYGGHDDWRVPTRRELESIVDLADTTAPIAYAAFTGAQCGGGCSNVSNPACSCTQTVGYWSASSYAHAPANAWLVSFFEGAVGGVGKTYDVYVRMVRGGS